MANVVDWLLDLFYLGEPKKAKTKSPTKKKLLPKGKRLLKLKQQQKRRMIKNYVGRKPKVENNLISRKVL